MTETRADQIYNRFVLFHRANPQLWIYFCRYADAMRRSGRKRYSARDIFARARWEMDLTATDQHLKLNNDYSAYYARMYLAKHPEAEGFFEVRRRKSAEHAAYEIDLPLFQVGRPIDEHALYERLRELEGSHDADR